ncbi:hypothetical protein JKF63_06427 [Porcisia hertigi]|uniref:Uncharacterized protein n=1 Tax=Porcisia hertigi TaxID=2761500 RepID=A0A836LJW8_9TRYP|nr:hypothetical protein JKF63_06427 [Porcisia hertigi]
MKPIILGFQIPSLRGACEQNSRRSSEASAAAQTLAVPYPIGKSTLQITGIHVRLQPVHASAGKPALKQPRTEGVSSCSALDGVVAAADVVVHAHVRGELSRSPQSYIVAIIPLRFDGFGASLSSTASTSSSAAATAHAGAAALLSTPYDKRVLNAQAREARRGVAAPVFASAFARIDLRTQMERVQLSFTVVPCGRTLGIRAAANGAAHVHTGKRRHGEAGGASDGESKPAVPQDFVLDVTVLGTVSAIL